MLLWNLVSRRRCCVVQSKRIGGANRDRLRLWLDKRDKLMMENVIKLIHNVMNQSSSNYEANFTSRWATTDLATSAGCQLIDQIKNFLESHYGSIKI